MKLLREKLAKAALEEEESSQSYREDAKKLKKLGEPESAKFVLKMADDEQRHSEELDVIVLALSLEINKRLREREANA